MNLMRMTKSTRVLGKVKRIMYDIDGTLYFKGSAIPGALIAISKT
jgi:ribonucleotide monophosphatase NagD (HAD superfamily)